MYSLNVGATVGSLHLEVNVGTTCSSARQLALHH